MKKLNNEKFKDLKLSITLIPQTSWYSNLRSILNKNEWEQCKIYSKKQSNNVCSICGNIGYKHKTECHEEWVFDDENKIQKLDKILALCPKCHQVKHIGLAQIKGNFNNVFKHLLKINLKDKKFNNFDMINYVENAFILFNERSKYNWKLDLSLLEELKDEIKLSDKTKEKIKNINN